MRIFLSYASEDRAVAEEVALALGGAGHDVFFDRSSLPAGGDFHARIQAAIDQTDLCVFLASTNSVRSGAYSLTELKLAREKWPHPEGHVLPVCLPGVAIEAMPSYLTSVTVLEPEGNVAAEVLAAVRKLQSVMGVNRHVSRGKLLIAAVAVIALGATGWWVWPDSPAPLPPPNGDGKQVPDKTARQRKGEALMERLEAANIQADTNNRSRVVGWIALEDRRYERIAEASLEALAGRKLRAPATIEVIVYKYSRLSGDDDEQGLPVDPTIDKGRIAEALVASFNERNGGSARTLDEIANP